MTKEQLKNEIVADLEHQLQAKGTGWTNERWYYSEALYNTGKVTTLQAIEELIVEGRVSREPRTVNGKTFSVLAI